MPIIKVVEHKLYLVSYFGRDLELEQTPRLALPIKLERINKHLIALIAFMVFFKPKDFNNLRVS